MRQVHLNINDIRQIVEQTAIQAMNRIRLEEAIEQISEDAVNTVLHKKEIDPAKRTEELNADVIALHDTLEQMKGQIITKTKINKDGETETVPAGYKYPKQGLPDRLTGREGQFIRVLWGDMYELGPIKQDEFGCPTFFIQVSDHATEIFGKGQEYWEDPGPRPETGSEESYKYDMAHLKKVNMDEGTPCFKKLKELIMDVVKRNELNVTLKPNDLAQEIFVHSKGRRYAQDPTNVKVWR